MTVLDRPALARKSASAEPPSHVLGWAVPLYLLLLSGGFAFLRNSHVALEGSELSIDRAAFTCINAVTGTGFMQSVGQDELKPVGRYGVTALVGIGAILTLSVGGTLVSRIGRMGYSERTIVLGSIGLVLAAALVGAATLSDSAGHGMMQGVGAIANCGLAIGAPLKRMNAPSTQLVLLPLAVVGGLGVPVLLDIARWIIHRRPIASHAAAALTMSAVIYLLGTALLALSAGASTASVLAINSRSAGFNLISIGQLSGVTRWLVLGLMWIGACPGGSAGGWKVTTPWVLWRGSVDAYRGRPAGRLFAIAVAWTIAFALATFAATGVLLAVQPQLGERTFFLAVSAITNTGLSSDPVALVGASLFVLGGIELVGRTLPVLVLWWACVAVEGDGDRRDAVAVG